MNWKYLRESIKDHQTLSQAILPFDNLNSFIRQQPFQYSRRRDQHEQDMECREIQGRVRDEAKERTRVRSLRGF